MGGEKALSIHYGHNSTVGLSVGGRVACLLSEERINRVKNATGFPFAALKYVIDHHLGGDADTVDAVVFNDETLLGLRYLESNGFKPRKYLDYYSRTRKSDIDKLIKSTVKEKLFPFRKARKVDVPAPSAEEYSRARNKLAELIGCAPEKITFLNHHRAHALSPFFFCGDNCRLVLTIDAEGDGYCATASRWQDGQLDLLDATPRELSLGYLYSEVTAYLGMRPNEHEFKVMGMAPYAHDAEAERLFEIFKKLLWFQDGKFVSFSGVSMMKLRNSLLRNLIYERFDNICAGIQLLTERLLCEYARYWIAQTGICDVVLSGGVMMNVKAVKCINELPQVNSVFVMPSAGDESLVIGGLFHANTKLLNIPAKPITDLYLGRDIVDSEIGNFFDNDRTHERYRIIKLDSNSMAETVADHLAKNHVVARCAGREEWGARALGNRSILCSASSVQNIEVINRQIKKRDFWMPFTPSILSEDIDLYVDRTNEISAPYMAITFNSTAKAQKEIPAALHPRDLTIRPQQVYQSWNPEYYEIIQKFKEKTGFSGILNTSFNLHGEPNVGIAADAIHTLDNSGLRFLQLGSYFVEKL